MSPFYCCVLPACAFGTQEGRDLKEFRAMAVSIFLAYIKSRRVKIVTAVQRKKIKKTITTPGRKLPASVYDEVQKVVFDVVYNGIYVRYLASRGSSSSVSSSNPDAPGTS